VLLAAILALVYAIVNQNSNGNREALGAVEATTTPIPATAVPTAEPTALAPTATPEPAPTSAPTATPAPTVTPAPATPAPTALPTAAPEPTTAPAQAATPEPSYPPLDSLPERGAVYRAPKLYLEGPIESVEVADAVVARAAAIVGEENIVNNYIIHPDAPEFTNGNVRVESAVLFQSGSSDIRPEFLPILGLGVAVMTTFPDVEMIVEGHTDSDGAADDNLELSASRAQAVLDFIANTGDIDRSRMQAVGFGEDEPIATNETALGRQLNRRIEVQLLNLLSRS